MTIIYKVFYSICFKAFKAFFLILVYYIFVEEGECMCTPYSFSVQLLTSY